MGRKTLHFLLLAALVAVSSIALADPPARVGRISATEGKVTMLVNGEEEAGNLLNWPVTNDNHVTTAPGARAEFRVGSAAVRLDGDSDIEIVALDEDRLRLRLNYGTASIRVRDPQMLDDFELSTPQARIVLTEPGTVRVDTERAPDTTTVNILAGTARVDGAGNTLTVRAGKRVEVRGDELLTSLAVRDRFDDWVQTRDRKDEGLVASRYLPNDVTGYEELDQYGSWSDNPEYGTLWMPRAVPVGWAPYRDGRWVWISPWGWTWIDNAPWGYAPSHYGRWVVVNSRWCWAPGRVIGRAVWSPALVGWVGGNNWSVTFSSRNSGPAVGWYPLSPRDRYVPGYRVSSDYERRLVWNHRNQADWQQRHQRRDDDGFRHGVTALPRDHFDNHRSISVATVPRAILNPAEVKAVPVAVTPGRPNVVRTPDWRDDRNDRGNRDGRDGRFDRDNRDVHVGRESPATRDIPVNRDTRADRNDRNDWRNGRNEQRTSTAPQQYQAPVTTVAPVVPAPQPSQQGILSTTPPQQYRPAMNDDRRANREGEIRSRREQRDDEERFNRGRQSVTSPPQAAPQVQFNPAPQPAPQMAPARQAYSPPPAPAPQQAQPPQQRQEQREERREHGKDRRERNEKER